MNKLKKIGFVILTWNSIKYIEQCINSIIIPPPRYDYEISIFDNGSSDGTVEYLRSIESYKIKVEYSEINLGTTVSRNRALEKLSKCDYVCILDSDTEIIDYEGFIRALNYLENNPSVGILGPSLYDDKGQLQYSGRNIPKRREKLYKVMPFKSLKKKAEQMEHCDYAVQPDVFNVGYLMSACLIMTWDNYLKIGKFDEKIFYAPEDIEYSVRAWAIGLKVVYYKKCKVLHYWQRISKKKFFSKHNYEHLKGLIYFYKKYKNLKQINKLING